MAEGGEGLTQIPPQPRGAIQREKDDLNRQLASVPVGGLFEVTIDLDVRPRAGPTRLSSAFYRKCLVTPGSSCV